MYCRISAGPAEEHCAPSPRVEAAALGMTHAERHDQGPSVVAAFQAVRTLAYEVADENGTTYAIGERRR